MGGSVRFRAVLRSSLRLWAALGGSVRLPGTLVVLGGYGAALGRTGAIVGRLWSGSGPHWAIVGSCERLWVALGSSWRLWVTLGDSWRLLEAPRRLWAPP